jgi:hypothetical protein
MWQTRTDMTTLIVSFRKYANATKMYKFCPHNVCIYVVLIFLTVNSFTYPACKAHAPYCLWLHHIFRYYFINGMIFGKKLLKIKCVFWFSLHLLFKTFRILRITERDTVINAKTSSCNAPVILVGFYWNLYFLDRFSKKKKELRYLILSDFIRCEPSCSMGTDGRTDMTRLIVAFCNFANAPKNRNKWRSTPVPWPRHEPDFFPPLVSSGIW